MTLIPYKSEYPCTSCIYFSLSIFMPGMNFLSLYILIISFFYSFFSSLISGTYYLLVERLFSNLDTMVLTSAGCLTDKFCILSVLLVFLLLCRYYDLVTSLKLNSISILCEFIEFTSTLYPLYNG